MNCTGKFRKFVKSFSPESEFEKLCSAVSTATKFLYSPGSDPVNSCSYLFFAHRKRARRGTVEGTRAAL